MCKYKTWLTVLALILAACGGSQGADSANSDATTGDAATETAAASENDGPSVVATTSILGDVVRNVVGQSATVEVLMGPGTDPHEYQPSAQEAESIRTADLVVANGLGLEEGLRDVIEAAEAEGTNVIELVELLDPIPFAGHFEDAEEEDTHGHGDEDPHFWQDPTRVAAAAELIGDRLTEIAPSADWDANAEAYADELRAVDAQIEQKLAAIPEDRRKIVTNHESFGYFAERYGFEIVGTVIPGGSTLAEPSASDLADLVAELEEEGVTAIFAENTNPSALAEAVAGELGTQVGVHELYSDSLGEPGSGADTYIGMIESNVETIVEALG